LKPSEEGVGSAVSSSNGVCRVRSVWRH